MVAGPEVAGCSEDFEDGICSVAQNPKEQGKHHHQYYPFQRHVKNLAEIIANFGNLFLEDCPESIALDTRNFADEPFECVNCRGNRS